MICIYIYTYNYIRLTYGLYQYSRYSKHTKMCEVCSVAEASCSWKCPGVPKDGIESSGILASARIKDLGHWRLLENEK